MAGTLKSDGAVMYEVPANYRNSGWYNHYYRTTGENPLEKFKVIYKCVIGLLGEQEVFSVLEIGCGTGALGSILSRLYDYRGIDFSPGAISSCIAHYPAIDVTYDDAMTYFNNKHDPVDAIVCVETLEHLRDDRGFIGLLPGGCLFIGSVPISGGLIEHKDSSHVREFESDADIIARYDDLIDIDVVRVVSRGKPGKMMHGVFRGRVRV